MIIPFAYLCLLLSSALQSTSSQLNFAVRSSEAAESNYFHLEKFENPIRVIRSFCYDVLNSDEAQCKQLRAYVATVIKTLHGEKAIWGGFEGDILSFGDSLNSKDTVEEWGKKSYHVDLQTVDGGAYSAVLQVPQFQTNIHDDIERFCQMHHIPGMGCRALSFELLNFVTSLYFREGGATIENIVSGMVFEMDIELAHFWVNVLGADGSIKTKYFATDIQFAVLNICRFCHTQRMNNVHCSVLVEHADEQLAAFYGDMFAGFLHVVQAVLNPEVAALFKSESSDLDIRMQFVEYLQAHPVETVANGRDDLKSASTGVRLRERVNDAFRKHNDQLFSFIERDHTATSKLPTDNSIAHFKKTQAESRPGHKSAQRRRRYSFAELGRLYGTDKLTHHGYHRFYPRFLEQYRAASAGQAMLEIGVDQSHSLRMWLEYFPTAFIYGVDIDVTKAGDRFKIFRADQSQLSTMKRIVEKEIHHPLFLIVDDGSHHPEHQVLCFEYLFAAALQPGGTYIIEDIETSYWTNANHLDQYPIKFGYLHERSVIEVFKALADDVNREFLSKNNRRAQEQRVGHRISAATRQMVSTVTFGQNCIIVTKKTEEEYVYNNRDYRFQILV